MKIFLTGGTGFVGRHLTLRLLQDGHTLLVFSKHAPGKEIEIAPRYKKNIQFLTGDISDINSFASRIKKFYPEVAVHLAWEGIPRNEGELNVRNLVNSIAVFKTCIAAGVSAIVGTGSCHEYGEPGKQVSEEAPFKPYNTLYATKIALYWLGSKLASEAGITFIWTRPAFIYGPGQRSGALLPYLFNSIKQGKTPTLKNPNGGNDFIYVGDVADALAAIIKKYKKVGTTIYNIGSGHLTPVTDMARQVYDALGFDKYPSFAKKTKSKVEGFWLDISKIKREIGWKPHTTLEQGVKTTIASFVKK